MKKKLALILALVMIFALALTACGDKDEGNTTPSSNPTTQPSQAPTDDGNEPSEGDEPSGPVEADWSNPILIGHLADLTGNEASTGLLGQAAVEVAAEIINANGGIAGRAVKIITEDTASNAANAATAARKLVEEDGVVAILGPTQMGHKQSVSSVAAELEVPVIAYNGTPKFYTASNDYFMSSGGATPQMPSVMADFLYNEQGFRKIYVITQEGTAGDNYGNPLMNNFKAMGGTVVDDIRVPADATDISSYVNRIVTGEDADCVVGWLSGTQGVGLWTSWYDQGVADKMPMYGLVHGGFTDYFIWLQLNNSRPEVVEKALEQGVYAPINWTYSIDTPENQAFVEAWTNAEFTKDTNYAGEPLGSNLPGAGYTALSLVKAAIESIDGNTDGPALYQALKTAQVNVAEGHTAIDGNTDSTVKDVYIAKVIKDANYQGGPHLFNYEIVKVYEDVPVDGLTAG